MARSVRKFRVETRAARARLAQRAEPYWTLLSEGLHLGYYRGRLSAKWVARYRAIGGEGGYTKTTLGGSDDSADADGVNVLNYRQAQDAARAWLRALEGGVQIVATYTVGDALDDYLKAFKGKDLANTRRRIEQFIRPALGKVQLPKLKSVQVRGFHNDLANAPARLRTRKGEVQQTRPLDTPEAYRKRKATANRILTVLKAALNRAYENERIASDLAWRPVKPFKDVDGAKQRYLSDDEARRLVNAAGAEFRPIVQAALLTGARWGELREIRVADVDLRAATVRLRETKAGKPRDCYLETEGLALFQNQMLGRAGDELLFPAPNGKKWTDATQTRRMTLACEAGQVKPAAGFHDLRRTYGARLALAGVPIAVIAQALGHADERITQKHYAHLAPSYVGDTVRKHAAGMGIFGAGADNVVPLHKASGE
jgi:integrase